LTTTPNIEKRRFIVTNIQESGNGVKYWSVIIIVIAITITVFITIIIKWLKYSIDLNMVLSRSAVVFGGIVMAGAFAVRYTGTMVLQVGTRPRNKYILFAVVK